VRPVNLIPQEERLGAPKSMRSGPTAYIIVGALVAALLGVTALVVANNQVDSLKGEIAQTETEIASTEAKVSELAAYSQFHSVREQRVATVTGLADSRFDWERVMRELALVLPGDVWLTDLTASASPAVAPGGGASIALRGSLPGPALTLIGCATGQEAVAGFVQALRDIDGVTRVAVPTSAVGGASSAESGSASSATCQTRDFIASFQMVVAFDAAPVASTATAATPEAAPAASSPEAEATVTE
jgi:Tfp pilus assembly protein PilN